MDSAGLQFIGFAYAYIFDDLNGARDTDHSATLLKMSLLPPEEKEIEAWVIIVAAASGLLFLSCVIFGLSKVSGYYYLFAALNEIQHGLFVITRFCVIFSADFSKGKRWICC